MIQSQMCTCRRPCSINHLIGKNISLMCNLACKNMKYIPVQPKVLVGHCSTSQQALRLAQLSSHGQEAKESVGPQSVPFSGSLIICSFKWNES